MKKVKKLFIKILVVLILVLLFIGFKSYSLYKFKIDTKNITTNNLDITYNRKEANFHVESLGFYLDEEYYTSIENELFIPAVKVEVNYDPEVPISGIDGLVVTEDKVSLVDSLGTIEVNIKHNIIQNLAKEDSNLSTIEYKELMKYSKLNNEMDLLDYYIKNSTTKYSVISPLYMIKTRYLANILVNDLDIDNYEIITNLNGILANKDNQYAAYLFNEGNEYIIKFENFLNKEDIIEFLSTINFN